MIEILKKLSRWLKDQTRIKNTARELSALTDRELSDLGISRSDIYRVAREAAHV